MYTNFKRIVRSGFTGFWRNAFVSLAAIFVMTVTLTVVGGVMILSELLDVSLAQIQNKVDIKVYFVTTASDENIARLKTSIEALPDVSEVTLTTRAEALDAFRDKHQGDALTLQALEELGDNPLGASLSIRAKETSQYESIDTFLTEQRANEDPNNPVIDRLNFSQNKEAIDNLTHIIGAVERSSYIAMIVLIASSVLITFNTIRLVIYTTREEISIMRLVGAGNMFIRGPFMLQGLMYGIIAGVLTLLIIYPTVLWLGPVTESFFSFNIFEYFVTHFSYFFATLVGAGAVLGSISSTLAVARYLHT